MIKIFCLISSLFAGLATCVKPLDEYVSQPEEVYKWEKLHNATFKGAFGSTIYVLNVTSLEWLNTSLAVGENGAVWTHLVYIAIPKKLTYSNVSFAYITGDDNRHPNKVSSKTDEDVLLIDQLADYSESVAIAIKQVPNQPIVYPRDPSAKKRTEDALLAWAWKEFMDDPNHDPRWLPRLPMVKASYQCMRAVQEFLEHNGIARVEGWVVAGGSKRGWTTWDVGVTQCDSCVKLLAIAPLVPIVPDLDDEVHRMWQAYGGFTWAFQDYLALDLIQRIDTPEWEMMTKIIDPDQYWERLARVPKYVVVSSDDEFMMFDWTNLYYDKLPGEKHLLITPNAEHSLVTNILAVASSLNTFTRSVAANHTVRPNFDYTYNPENGEISVQMHDTNQQKPKKVSLRYAQNLSKKRRDFRWIFQANNNTEPCKLPFFPVPANIIEKRPDLQGTDDLCVAPIIWGSKTLKESSPGVYKALPPKPRDGYWMGYYIEVEFPGDTPGGGAVIKNHFLLTTPGWTWPNTLPYPDCHGKDCANNMV